MSTETIKMCDVQNCGKVSQHTLEYVTVAVRDINPITTEFEEGLFIWTSEDVDMCGEREYLYRTSLPQIKLNEMDKRPTKPTKDR